MVLFIKPVTSVIDDMDLVCKMMINIEQNKNIFNVNGILNTNNKKPFNNFVYQDVNYEMTVSMGVLLLYIPFNSTIKYGEIEQRLIHNFRENIGLDDYDIKVPINTHPYNSTNYTLLTTEYTDSTSTIASNIGGKVYRRIINNIHDVRKGCESGSKFIWLLQIIDRPYLQIPELSVRIPNKIHLMRSISTIIYDGTQLFNVKHGLHQLDYPSLSQYNMFKNNQILDEPIHISQISGLDYEIARCYDNTISNKLLFSGSTNTLFSTVDHTKFKIRRPNPEKKWYQQLSEPFDFDEQEYLERNIKETGKPVFHNDICFIMGIPLYKKAYLLKVSYIPKMEDVDNKKYNSYILVSAYVYHTITGHHDISIDNYLHKYKISVINTRITNFNRSEADAIDMIPKKNISPLKREIMKSLSVNGAHKKGDEYSECIYTADVQKNKIYIGIINNINDTNIIKYNNTNTILFQAILLDHIF